MSALRIERNLPAVEESHEDTVRRNMRFSLRSRFEEYLVNNGVSFSTAIESADSFADQILEVVDQNGFETLMGAAWKISVEEGQPVLTLTPETRKFPKAK